MKNGFRQTWPLFLPVALLVTAMLGSAACQSNSTNIQGYLETFNNETALVIDGFDNIYESITATESAISADDMEAAGLLIEQGEIEIATTLAALDRLERAENAITELQSSRAPISGFGSITQPLGFVGAALVITSLAVYCKKLKDAQKEASAAWKKTSDTLHDVGEGKATAEDYHREKNVLIEKNQKGLEIINNKVMSYSLSKMPGGGTTGTAVKMTLKKKQAKGAEEGVGIMFASKGCADAADCLVGATKTDSEGKVPAFSGELTIVASKPDMARVVATDVQVTEGQTTTIEREDIPVKEATPEKVTANDNGTYDPEDYEKETEGDGDSSRPWILCHSFEDLFYHYACTVYTGDPQDLCDGDYMDAMAQCISAGYSRYSTYFTSVAGMSAEKACIDECLYYQAGGAQGDAVCDTPN